MGWLYGTKGRVRREQACENPREGAGAVRWLAIRPGGMPGGGRYPELVNFPFPVFELATGGMRRFSTAHKSEDMSGGEVEAQEETAATKEQVCFAIQLRMLCAGSSSSGAHLSSSICDWYSSEVSVSEAAAISAAWSLSLRTMPALAFFAGLRCADREPRRWRMRQCAAVGARGRVFERESTHLLAERDRNTLSQSPSDRRATASEQLLSTHRVDFHSSVSHLEGICSLLTRGDVLFEI